MPFVHRALIVVSGFAALTAVTLGTKPYVSSRSSVNSSPDSAAIAGVVNDYHEALSTGDSARALQLLAPDAQILESGGMETRAEYRSHHLSGDIAFAKAVASSRGPMRVTVEGNTAWTAATSTTQGTFNARAINSVGAESMVLTKGPEGWRIRAIHWSSRNRRPPAS
jgi:ketosteroid isomerase-like protein